MYRAKACLRLLKSLRAVMEILAREPVMVDTGQYQAKYALRTFADMQGEIANELTQLTNFHAKVKLATGEYVLRMQPPPQGLTGEQLQARISQIKQQMRFLGYVRDAGEVEEEIRKRHARL